MNSNQETKILIIEDELNLARSIQIELIHENYRAEIAQNGYEALGKISNQKWDLFILDLLLPDLDGFQICQKIRAGSEAPIIIVTALNSIPDKVKGLNIGANDYVTKPFAMEELSARIKAHLRQRQGGPSQEKNKLTIKDLEIHYDTRQVTRGGRFIPLSKREYDLLCYLAENTGLVVSRESILNDVWGYDFINDTNVVDVYIRYLRSKIDDSFPSALIHTVRGIGYTLREEGPLHEESSS